MDACAVRRYPICHCPTVRLSVPKEWFLTSTRPAGLRRALGTVFGLAIAVGATVGAGILGAPGDGAAALPRANLYLLAWVVGGIITLLRELFSNPENYRIVGDTEAADVPMMVERAEPLQALVG